MGAATPPIVTLTPPTLVESGVLSESVIADDRFDPKIETSEPGAMACVEEAPAVFTTPLLLMAGDWANAAQVRRAKRAMIRME
jgi:hypothetical protein